MIAKALRRARTRYGLFIIAALLFTAGVFGAIGLTSAIFQARFDSKTATFAGGYVATPVGPVWTASGFDGALTWTNGTDETTTANEIQQIFGLDRGTTSNCTSPSYSTTVTNSISSPTTTTTFTYTDSNRGSSINGDYYCYEILHGWPSTTAPVWTATTPATPAPVTFSVTTPTVSNNATTLGTTSTSPSYFQVGLAPISVVINNGATGDGKPDNMDTSVPRSKLNDVIVITYNQAVTVTTGTSPITSAICQYQTGGVILIGDTGCAGTATTDSYTVGKLTGLTNMGGDKKKATALIYYSGNQITILITQADQTITAGPTGFVSSTIGNAVKSLATTDQATPCTSASATCTLTPSGHF